MAINFTSLMAGLLLFPESMFQFIRELLTGSRSEMPVLSLQLSVLDTEPTAEEKLSLMRDLLKIFPERLLPD